MGSFWGTGEPVVLGGSERGSFAWGWSSQSPAGGSYPLHGDGCLHLGGHGIHPGRHPEPVEPLVLLADGILGINPGTLHVLLLQGLAHGESMLREPPMGSDQPMLDLLDGFPAGNSSPVTPELGMPQSRNKIPLVPLDVPRSPSRSRSGGWAGDLPFSHSHMVEGGNSSCPHSAEHRQEEPHPPF